MTSTPKPRQPKPSAATSARALAEMLIHKPVPEVFAAFVRPAIIQRFWLKSTTGPLAPNATLNWEFMVEGARETVTVTSFTENERLAFTWSDGVSVELTFEPSDTASTRLAVAADGFQGADAHSQAVTATEGFAIVFCDLKSLLESGRSGNMVRDKAALLAARNDCQ